jgi:hypothetical protein
MSQSLLIELNELNFDFVNHYADVGLLPNLGKLIKKHGVIRTLSEEKYEELEPWIQWVSAHTGMTLAEHGVFRLGDAVGQGLYQIWEHLENAGLSVGAVSPMNAENQTHNAAFFLPDPWTDTRTTGGLLLRRLHEALRQAVNDNARSHLSVKTLLWLMAALVRYARLPSSSKYMKYSVRAGSRSWYKALLLDLLLSDLFIGEIKRTSPDFASLFLNAGAHIQHHYLFNAAPYTGSQSNPSWYIDKTQDPLLDVYKLYDNFIGEIIRLFPNRRLIVATGLHQDPHPATTFYWRLTKHEAFLKRIGVNFECVEPRMSRDFLVKCVNLEQALATEQRLMSVRGDDGVHLFEVDNRGSDLFVSLSYANDVPEDFGFYIGPERFDRLRREIDFVAIKNGEHNGIGYLIDTAQLVDDKQATIKLTSLPDIICDGFGLEWPQTKIAKQSRN